MEVELIRHGMTASNMAGRYIGRTDEPLSTEGIAAIRKNGEFPDISRVYVSSMRRARETAALLFPCADLIICDDLREMDFGDFEGKSAQEMECDAAYRTWVDAGCLNACPNGEGISDFSGRVISAFDRIVREEIRRINSENKAAEGNPVPARQNTRGNDRLIIVAHGGTIMAVMQAFAWPRRTFYDWHIGNGNGWRAQMDETCWDRKPALTGYRQMEGMSL
jgi:alpha-ribazole phosphatase